MQERNTDFRILLFYNKFTFCPEDNLTDVNKTLTEVPENGQEFTILAYQQDM